MTSLLSAKKRAEEFAAVVDGGADESTLRSELRELVGVVGTLQREAQVGAQLAPRSEFTAMLREQLMAEAATALSSDNILKLPPRTKGTRERRIALVASSVVLVGGTAGMAAAAQNALPGEALYPIKRGLENAQTGLATNPADQGQDLLAQANNRLVEVQGLFDSSGNLTQVPATIDDFTRQALEASDVLIKEYETSQDEAVIVELRQFARDNLIELQELSKTADTEYQDELATAAEALTAIDARARAICSSCAEDLDTLVMPTYFLVANEARVAIDAARRVVVDNTHPVPDGAVSSEPKGDRKDKEPAGDGDGGSTGQAVPETGPTEGTDTDPEGTDTEGPSTEGGDDTGILPEVPEVQTDGGSTQAEGPPSVLDGGSNGGGSNGDSKDDGAVKSVIPKDLQDAVETLVP